MCLKFFDRLFLQVPSKVLVPVLCRFVLSFCAGSFFRFFLRNNVFGCDESGVGKRKQAAAQYHITSHRRRLGVDY